MFPVYTKGRQMKASLTLTLVNAPEVFCKPRCQLVCCLFFWQLAKQCLLSTPCSTSGLQHEGSHHSDIFAIAGQMPYAMTSNKNVSLKRLPTCCTMLLVTGMKTVQLLGHCNTLSHDQQVE